MLSCSESEIPSLQPLVIATRRRTRFCQQSLFWINQKPSAAPAAAGPLSSNCIHSVNSLAFKDPGYMPPSALGGALYSEVKSS
jgi:hypothetical protein